MRALLLVALCGLFLAVVQAEVDFIPVGTTTAPVPPPCDNDDCDPPAAWDTASIIPNPGPELEAGLKDVPTRDSGLKAVPPLPFVGVVAPPSV
jgi:hypothetical protein